MAVDLTPSSTTGTAPLYVFFEGIDTTHTDADVTPFRDLDCEWDFGDTSAGTWSVSGDSKNAAHGCMAGHVFESAGAFTVRLTVTDEAGEVEAVETTVTVTAGDSTWAGSNTVCIRDAADGTFAGCPDGALQVTNSDYDDALANDCDVHNNDASLRCLFRRGDTFSLGSATQLLDGPIMIGAFGTGADPIINIGTGDFHLHNLGLFSASGSASDIRITGLDFRGDAAQQTNGNAVIHCSSEATNGIEDILLMDLTLNEIGTMIACADEGSPTKVPDLIAAVDITITEPDHRSVGFISGTRVSILGVDALANGSQSGHMRTSFVSKFVLQHNKLYGSLGNQVVKTSGYDADGTGGTQVSSVTQQRYWLISDNDIQSDLGIIGGMNNVSDGASSVLDYAVIERNWFELLDTADRVLNNPFSVLAFRNNILKAEDNSANPFMVLDGTGDQPYGAPDDVQVYGNTFYALGTQPRHMISVSGATGVIARNNIYYTPSETDDRRFSGGCSSGCTESNNTQFDETDRLVGNTTNGGDGLFDEAADFQIETGSALDGSGFDFFASDEDGESLFLDFNGADRSAGSFDPGALPAD